MIQAVESGLFSIKRPPLESPLGRALFAAKVASLQMARTKELAQLNYHRAVTFASVSKSKAALADEESMYYKLFNAIAGTDINVEAIRARRMHEAKNKYASLVKRVTGLDIDSSEFVAMIDAQCKAMLAPTAVS